MAQLAGGGSSTKSSGVKKKRRPKRRPTRQSTRNYNVWGLSPAQVRAVQETVGVTADGVYGPQTAAAVRRWQSHHGLAVDGIVGPDTASKMGVHIGAGRGNTRSGTHDLAPVVAAKDYHPDRTAARFGYTLSFFNASPELKKLLSRATKQNWSSERFTAEFQNTHWFRNHSESYRKFTALEKGDPATLKQMLSSAESHLRSIGQSLGVTRMTGKDWNQIAKHAIMFGWTEDQQKAALASHIQTNQYGRFEGEAGQYKQKFEQILGAYGIHMPDKHVGAWVKAAVRDGSVNEAYVQQFAQQAAMSKYPGIRDRLAQGETVQEVADPYIQSYAQLLEVNPKTVGLDNPLIKKALSMKDKHGKPTTASIWQLEQWTRNTPRWLRTDNAQDETMQAAHQVLSDLGLAN